MNRRVVAVVSDLLFRTRIAETAKQAGVDFTTIPSGIALSALENDCLLYTSPSPRDS